jgi:hypothetical protein
MQLVGQQKKKYQLKISLDKEIRMLSKEKIQHRINTLKNKHRQIHKTVEALEAEKAPTIFITKKKKEKLAIKDEIEGLISQL